jgi:hypothetical protein
MSVHDLEQAIDATRRDLNQTLHALQDRFSPARRLEAAWGATRIEGAGAVRGGMSWAISHPVTVLAIVAVMVLALYPRIGDRMSAYRRR